MASKAGVLSSSDQVNQGSQRAVLKTTATCDSSFAGLERSQARIFKVWIDASAVRYVHVFRDCSMLPHGKNIQRV
jgi:hypothetical protein